MDKSIQTVIFYVMKTLKHYYQTRVDNLGPDTLKGDRLHIFNVHIILSMPFGGHWWVVVGGGVGITAPAIPSFKNGLHVTYQGMTHSS